MITFATKQRGNIKASDLKTAEQRRQDGKRQEQVRQNRNRNSLSSGPFVLSPSPSATKESSTNDVFDCSHLTPFSKWCKPQYGSEPSSSLAVFLDPAQDVSILESDCLDAGDKIEAEMMETYLSLHPPSVAASEPTANNKSDASETELAGRFSSLSIVCNAMEVDEDEMDIDLPDIDWMQVDCDEMEIDGP